MLQFTYSYFPQSFSNLATNGQNCHITIISNIYMRVNAEHGLGSYKILTQIYQECVMLLTLSFTEDKREANRD